MNSSISTYSTITFAAPTIGAVSQSSFTGKGTDWETGYSYFGARYYDPTLLTSWTAVDPMADKYPNISPYAYCNWNPIKITDPDGRDWYIPEGATEPIWQKDVTEDNLPQGARYIGSTAHWTGQTESDMDFRYHGDENGNITREDITYIITEKTTNTYDVNKAVTYLQQNALTKSIGKCARYTTNAINYGGGENVKRDDAYKMGPNLLAGGFYTVNVDFSQAQKGDVAVIQGFLRSQHPDVQLNKDHPWGHMQMFDGRQWISDFKQSGFWPGGDYKKVQPKYTIYRHYLRKDIMKKKMFFCLFLFLGSSTFIIGQPSQDIGINYLNEFYARYVASCCKEYNESYFDFLKNHGVQNIDSSADAEERLLKENCTDELYAKIDSLRVLYILDYDPFICAQDCFKGLFSFSITNHSIPEWYQMNYMDDSNQERVIYLNLVKINGKLKIANIRTCLNEDIMDLSTNEENAEYK